MSGKVPASVTADRPEPGLSGVMRNDWTAYGTSTETAPDLMLSLLIGPMAAGEPNWPPSWPLGQEERDSIAHNDGGALAVLAGFLDLDERGWCALVERAERTAESEPFRRIVTIIASTLERIDVLSGDDIRFLVGPELCRAHGIEPVEEVPAWST